jgi:hypothetical protein
MAWSRPFCLSRRCSCLAEREERDLSAGVRALGRGLGRRREAISFCFSLRSLFASSASEGFRALGSKISRSESESSARFGVGRPFSLTGGSLEAGMARPLPLRSIFGLGLGLPNADLLRSRFRMGALEGLGFLRSSRFAKMSAAVGSV